MSDSIIVSEISGEKLPGVEELFSASPFKPHRFLSAELGPELVDFWYRTFKEDSLENENSITFSASVAGRLTGLAVCAALPWESKVLNVSACGLKHFVLDPRCEERATVANTLMDRADAWAHSLGLDCMMAKVYSDDSTCIHALERAGFLLMDTELNFIYDTTKGPLPSIRKQGEGIEIRPAVESDIDELAVLAGRAFKDHFGRFHSDEALPRTMASRVYEEWIRSSWNGYADWMFVAEVDNRLAGCSIWRKPSALEESLGRRVGHYSIGFVDPAFKSRGLFASLTYRGMETLCDRAHVIEGPTHVDNLPVQRAYDRLGWQACGAIHAFHKWFKRP